MEREGFGKAFAPKAAEAEIWGHFFTSEAGRAMEFLNHQAEAVIVADKADVAIRMGICVSPCVGQEYSIDASKSLEHNGSSVGWVTPNALGPRGKEFWGGFGTAHLDSTFVIEFFFADGEKSTRHADLRLKRLEGGFADTTPMSIVGDIDIFL